MMIDILMKIYVKLRYLGCLFLGEGLKMPYSVAIILIAVTVTMGIADLAFGGIF